MVGGYCITLSTPHKHYYRDCPQRTAPQTEWRTGQRQQPNIQEACCCSCWTSTHPTDIRQPQSGRRTSPPLTPWTCSPPSQPTFLKSQVRCSWVLAHTDSRKQEQE